LAEAPRRLKRPTHHRHWSRKNLEQHVRKGTLPRSTLQTCPVRVDSDLVVAEFVANTDPAQAWSMQG
jgi:hypothetical protein